MNADAYSLQDIANWQLNPSQARVAIPRLQRGLVWNAIRMELLWDSILRGIPIGSFVVCNRTRLPKQDRKSDVQAVWYLLDGQQRSAAITMAFRDFPPADDDGLPILWLDAAPDESANRKDAGKSREYWFKVTTRAHPWGYKYRPKEVDGRDTVFSTWERKASIALLGDRANLGRRPSPSQLWPRQARSPIPFSFMRRAYHSLRDTNDRPVVDGAVFWERVSALIADAAPTHWREVKWRDIERPDEHFFAKLLVGLECAYRYEVVALRTPDALLEEGAGSDEVSGVSVLFERINTLGVTPHPEELMYSVLKALWPQLYDIDEVARGRMFPYRMAVLAVQVFTIHDGGGKWDQPVTTPFLRALMRNAAQDDNGRTVRQRIEAFIARGDPDTPSFFEQACATVDEWLGFDRTTREYREDAEWGLLKVHRTAIAEHRPAVYKLLLLLALKPAIVDSMDRSRKLLASLAVLISWFADKPGDVAERVYRALSELSTGWEEAIRKVLLECVDSGALLLPCPPRCLSAILGTDADPIELIPRQAKRSAWWPSLSRVWSPFGGQAAHEMLLYAQRLYMKLPPLFGDYDPSQRDMWETYNRPWDLDHILPRSWLCRRQRYQAGQFIDVGEFFRDSAGNIVAIPFSANRSKNAAAPDEQYCQGYEDLLWLDGPAIRSYVPVNYDRDRANCEHFVRTARARFISLYTDCYDSLDFADWFAAPMERSALYLERCKLIQGIQTALGDAVDSVIQTSFYRSNELIPVEPLEDVWFCDRVYFTLGEAVGKPVLRPFLSHKRDGTRSRACFVGLLKPPEALVEKARTLASAFTLDMHEDSIHVAYSQQDDLANAVALFAKLAGAVAVGDG